MRARALLLALVLGACTKAQCTQVQSAMTPAEECVAGAALQLAVSGGFSDPVAAVTAILASCLGATVDDIISAIDKLGATQDAGPSTQLLALRKEAVRRKNVAEAGK